MTVHSGTHDRARPRRHSLLGIRKPCHAPLRHRLRTLMLVLALGPASLAGCVDNRPPSSIAPAEEIALATGDSFELLSLEPLESPSAGGFHGWKVLGKVSVEGNARQELVEALKKGVAENRDMVAECFQPRHGIQVKSEGTLFAFVICFECMSADSFIGDKRGNGFLVSHSPQPVFDNALRRAGIPLAKPAH